MRDSAKLLRAAQEVFRDNLVSVVMPTFNQAEFLPPVGRQAEALNSVLGQTHRNLQVIVVDDGSTDETPQILRAFRDPRLEVIRHRKNRGLPVGLSTGYGSGEGREDSAHSPHCLSRSSPEQRGDWEGCARLRKISLESPKACRQDQRVFV